MSYRDKSGRVYMVMPAILKDGSEQFTVMFRKPDGLWMIKMPLMTWHRTYTAAQKDLDDLAARKGWAIA